MRLFLAIRVPQAISEVIFRDALPLRRAAPEASWVRPELLHFTVKFLGEVGEERIVPLRDAVGAVLAAHPPFAVQLAGAGSFPNFRRPRVVWIGVKDRRTISALAEDVEEACELLGFERDARGFSAHVTLGRIKKDLPAPMAERLHRAALASHNEYSVSVSSLDLVRSELSASGPAYTTLVSFGLGGAE